MVCPAFLKLKFIGCQYLLANFLCTQKKFINVGYFGPGNFGKKNHSLHLDGIYIVNIYIFYSYTHLHIWYHMFWFCSKWFSSKGKVGHETMWNDVVQENFTTPRAAVSLRFFNCFRLLLEKAQESPTGRTHGTTDPAKNLSYLIVLVTFSERGPLVRSYLIFDGCFRT